MELASAQRDSAEHGRNGDGDGDALQFYSFDQSFAKDCAHDTKRHRVQKSMPN